MTADAEATLRAKLKRTFETFDEDGSGEVSTSEITQVLYSLGIDVAPEKVEAIIQEADTDGNVRRPLNSNPTHGGKALPRCSSLRVRVGRPLPLCSLIPPLESSRCLFDGYPLAGRDFVRGILRGHEGRRQS